MYLGMDLCIGTHEGQKTVSFLPELQRWTIVSCLSLVPGIKLSSARTASTLSHCAISLALSASLFR